MSLSPRLAALRAALQAQQSQKNALMSGTSPQSFPHWLTPEGQPTLIRYLPDADETNPYLHVEKIQSSMLFHGVVGGSSEDVTIKVVSPKTFGLECPITERIRPYWETQRDLAKQYYPRSTYICSGLVVQTAVKEDRVPENPIRLFYLNKQLQDATMAGLRDPEIEEMPSDFEHGRDFKIIKTKQGGFANYSTSTFSMKERALSSDERSAVEKFGLVTLSEKLGKAPDDEELAVIKAMLEDSLAGKPFDVASFGKFYGGWLKPKDKDDTGTGPVPEGLLQPVPFDADGSRTIEAIRGRKFAQG